MKVFIFEIDKACRAWIKTFCDCRFIKFKYLTVKTFNYIISTVIDVDSRKIIESIVELTLRFSKAIKFHPELEKLRAVELYALFYLIKYGPCKMKELADALSTTKANVTHLIDTLEKKGFVKRTPDESDRRVIQLRVTQHGERVYNELIEELSKLVERIMSSLDPNDSIVISKGFEKFLEIFIDSKGEKI
ncbi:MarR family winged helix-turn-helix transcriptional regulator [Pseudothermotoga sp.]